MRKRGTSRMKTSTLRLLPELFAEIDVAFLWNTRLLEALALIEVEFFIPPDRSRLFLILRQSRVFLEIIRA